MILTLNPLNSIHYPLWSLWIVIIMCQCPSISLTNMQTKYSPVLYILSSLKLWSPSRMQSRYHVRDIVLCYNSLNINIFLTTYFHFLWHIGESKSMTNLLTYEPSIVSSKRNKSLGSCASYLALCVNNCASM